MTAKPCHGIDWLHLSNDDREAFFRAITKRREQHFEELVAANECFVFGDSDA